MKSFNSGGKDLVCLNGGKCKDHQCQCSENFMGHDCSIGIIDLIMFRKN